MWYDHMHGCMLLISMLLETNTLVMIITLICLEMHTGRKPWKNSALGRYEFVTGLRRDGYVWYGMARWYERWPCWMDYICYTNHAGNTWTSWVDRRSSLVPVTPILVSYYHSSLQQVEYGSVSCQPLSSTHRIERPWWKILVVTGRQATWSGSMGVSGWDREGRPPLRARDINLIPCYARL